MFEIKSPFFIICFCFRKKCPISLSKSNLSFYFLTLNIVIVNNTCFFVSNSFYLNFITSAWFLINTFMTKFFASFKFFLCFVNLLVC